MLSSPLYTMLKLSKTTSPQKLFPSDCITLFFFKYTFSSITVDIQKLHNKYIKRFKLFIFFFLNAVFNTLYHVKAVQDDIYVKTVPIWLHHTVCKELWFPGNVIKLQVESFRSCIVILHGHSVPFYRFSALRNSTYLLIELSFLKYETLLSRGTE